MPKFTVAKDDLSEVANELIKAAKFKIEDRYKSEQDFLAALARASNKMSDDKFEELTEEAADWVNDAIQALKDKEELPPLPLDEGPALEEELEPDDEDEDEDEQPVRRKAAAKSKAAEEEPEDVDDEDVDDDDNGDDDADDDEDDADADDDEDDEDEPEPEPEPEPIRAKAKVKPTKEKAAKVDKTGKKRRSPREYADAEKDAYGLVKGTAVSDAVRMFEKGASMKMVKSATGSSQYNILQKLSQDGHLVQKHEGVITIKHKDKLDKKEKTKVAEAQEETKERIEAQEAAKHKPQKEEKPIKVKSRSAEPEDDDDDDDEDEAPPPVKSKSKVRRERVR